MHKKNPFKGPYKVGDNKHKNIGPGMAKACNNMYKYKKANIVYPK
jgi:hypothetical protein